MTKDTIRNFLCNGATTEALPSALAKAVKAFPHLASLPERDLARNACRLVIPGLSGLELLALIKAAGKGAK